jgi:hypothetical protein
LRVFGYLDRDLRELHRLVRHDDEHRRDLRLGGVSLHRLQRGIRGLQLDRARYQRVRDADHNDQQLRRVQRRVQHVDEQLGDL